MKKSREVDPNKLFYDSVKNLVENMFTRKNPNFKSYYYAQKGGFEFQSEVERMAALVLDKMEEWKHLIDLPPSNAEDV